MVASNLSPNAPLLDEGMPLGSPPAQARRPPSRRLPASTLTGRSEGDDRGTHAIKRLNRAEYTERRTAFDPFDAMAKRREAQEARVEGERLLAISPETHVLRASGEALVHTPGPITGLTPEQLQVEVALLDTLEHPNHISLGASQLRMEAVQRLGILQPALDASETVQAGNSLEKMLAHQLTACHFAAMTLLARAMAAGESRAPDPVQVTRYTNAAARMMDCYQAGMLALLKFKTGGKQNVVVQHVHVADGGQAVIAGAVGGPQGSCTPGEGR